MEDTGIFVPSFQRSKEHRQSGTRQVVKFLKACGDNPKLYIVSNKEQLMQPCITLDYIINKWTAFRERNHETDDQTVKRFISLSWMKISYQFGLE